MNSLVDYSSGSDEDDKPPDSSEPESASKQTPKRLPLPKCLLSNVKRDEVVDDPSQNDGRIRSFPHQRGNWASYVFIPLDKEEEAWELCDRLSACVNQTTVRLKPVSSPHVSLTRTFVLLYHWIPEFVSTASASVSALPNFRLGFGDIDVYVNDEGTRTFLGLTVTTGYAQLAAATRALDSCLKQYNLKPFYEEGRFHASIAWCLGDSREYLVSLLPRLRETTLSFLSQHPLSSSLEVSKLYCKTGNRTYAFSLAPS